MSIITNPRNYEHPFYCTAISPCVTNRYFFVTDPEESGGDDSHFGELWSFTAAALPRIHECDSDVAATIRANTDIMSDDAPVSEGYASLKAKLESVYPCLGISCSQVESKITTTCVHSHRVPAV